MRSILAAVAAIAIGLFGAAEARADKLQDILSKGVVRIGVPLDAPPFGSQDANRNPIGFDIEMAEMVAKALGVKLEGILLTHTHFDHTGSNTEFPATVEFVAHENTRENMARATCQPVTNCDAFKGDNAKYLPKRTYKDKLTLFGGRDQIDLYYFGRGHTSGDTFVVFPTHRAMHAGDMFPLAQMPFIDFANSGGSATEAAG